MPQMTKAFLVLAALLAAPASGASNSGSAYITAKDLEVASDSSLTAIKYCGVAEDPDAATPAEARETLLAALGGTNIVLEAMEDSKDKEELKTQVQENFQEAFIQMVMPIVFAIVCIICLGCFGCTAVPCFKNISCCRCCKKERETSCLMKGVCCLPIVLCIVMTIVGVATATQGSTTMVSGFESMACASADLLNSTLQGKQTEPTFIGLLPGLTTLEGIDRSLNNGSGFMIDLTVILDDTVAVTEAIRIASGVLSTFGDVMALPANTAPTFASDGSTTYHKCDFCATLAAPLAEVSTALTTGIGAALASAREEVELQLSWTKRQELQQTLRGSMEPMQRMKTTFVDTLSPFVNPDDDPLTDVKDLAPIAVALVFVGAFIVIACSCCSSGWFIAREKNNGGAYSKGPHRIACCTWCWALVFSILCFFFGGLLNGASVPMAGVCLIMDDVDGAMVERIAPSLGLNISGPNGTNFVMMLDNCVNPANTSLNANFLDLIVIQNATDGTNWTMREGLMTSVRDPIDAQFDNVIAQMAAGNANLASSTAITSLKSKITSNPIKAMILTDAEAMQADSVYAPFAGSPLASGYTTSLQCLDHIVTADDGTTTTVPGISDFSTELEAWGAVGTPLVGVSCGDTRTCTGETGLRAQRCNAGNSYLNLYASIASSIVTRVEFRCDLWEDPNDSSLYCDIKDMNAVTGVGSCLNSAGVLTVKQKTCNLEEFNTYYLEMSVRIDKSMTYVDNIVNAKKDGIATGLKNLVATYLLDPLIFILNGVSCGWLPGFWQEAVNSLCYRGVYGMRRIGQGYIIASFFVLILALDMYILWRRSIDNVNSDACNQERNVVEAQM